MNNNAITPTDSNAQSVIRKLQTSYKGQQIVKARSSKKIAELNSLELGVLITSVCFLVGMNDMPGDAEYPILKDYILKNYGKKSSEEFKLAFEYAIQDRFDVEINHYNIFSPKYIDAIQRAYQRYAHAEVKKYNDTKALLEAPKPKQETTEEKIKLWKSRCREQWHQLNESGHIKHLAPLQERVYNYLKVTGQILLTDQERADVLKRAKYLFSDRGGERRIRKRTLNVTEIKKEKSGIIESYAKQIALADFLKSITEEELNQMLREI